VHEILTNPMWSALCTTHAHFALESGALKRFAPEVAPFCAVEHAGAALHEPRCMVAGESVFFLGTLPSLPKDWNITSEFSVMQMVYDASGAATTDAGDDAAALGERDHPAMLALTALAYPEFFRPQTPVLGNYIGIPAPEGLAAMAGQRLACTGYREISAVVTHPAHRGHGHAGRLIRQLTRMIVAEGRTPFLHVSASNKSAWGLYENLGFVPARELHCIKVRVPG
jgi:ribosomal protein S18 acetylase RimI-like enzyme